MTRSRRLLLSLLLAVLLAGCGSDEVVKPQPPAPFPANDTPENTILRFIAAYERKDSTVFAQLFTGDYQSARDGTRLNQALPREGKRSRMTHRIGCRSDGRSIRPRMSS